MFTSWANDSVNWETVFDLVGKQETLTRVEKEMSKPGFWDGPRAGCGN